MRRIIFALIISVFVPSLAIGQVNTNGRSGRNKSGLEQFFSSQLLKPHQKITAHLKSSAALKWYLDSAWVDGYSIQEQAYNINEKRFYQYNGLGECIQEDLQYLDTNGNIVAGYIIDNYYDQQGLHVMATTSFLDTATMTYVQSERILYSYDEGLLIELKLQYKDGLFGSFVDVYRENYSYEQNLLRSEVHQDWSATSIEWRNVAKHEYFYNSSDVLKYVTNYDFQSGAWVYTGRKDNTYQGGLLTEEYFTFNASMGGTSEAKKTYVYDSQGNLIDCNYSVLAQGSWRKSHGRAYEFDASVAVQDLLLPKLVWTYDELIGKFQSKPMACNYVDYYLDPNGISLERIFYHYNLREVNAIGEISKNLYSLRAYPNPATTEVAIDVPDQSEYRILDQVGRVIASGRVLNGRINVANLHQGYYTIVVGQSRASIIKQ
ncbi:MAG TPA: T9SS type A sorting domain-containing protein [Luteibaculaceae bacterium]|nr:T9SS type A sorting domain-containing protein [Luteibaculaceae bacterium]